MTHCTAWILAIILCIVLAQLPTITTSEYIQPKYNVVPEEVIILDLSFILQKGQSMTDWFIDLELMKFESSDVQSDR